MEVTPQFLQAVTHNLAAIPGHTGTFTMGQIHNAVMSAPQTMEVLEAKKAAADADKTIVAANAESPENSGPADLQSQKQTGPSDLQKPGRRGIFGRSPR